MDTNLYCEFNGWQVFLQVILFDFYMVIYYLYPFRLCTWRAIFSFFRKYNIHILTVYSFWQKLKQTSQDHKPPGFNCDKTALHVHSNQVWNSLNVRRVNTEEEQSWEETCSFSRLILRRCIHFEVWMSKHVCKNSSLWHGVTGEFLIFVQILNNFEYLEFSEFCHNTYRKNKT